MPARSTRSLALSAVLVLGLSTLAACGTESDRNDDGSLKGGGMDTVTIEGEAGAKPEVTFDGVLQAEEDVVSEVLIEGDGEVVEPGQAVMANLWLGNGVSEREVYSTWEAAPEMLTVGPDLSDALREAIEGRKIGDRVAVLSSAEDSFGEHGNAALGVGNKDAVLWVVDIDSLAATGPSGEEKTPATWAPSLKLDGDKVTGFDFSTTKFEPGSKLLSTTLIKGDGPIVEKGQTINVNYLGQVWGGEAPFDESYSRGEPTSFPIGVGQVVKGWDEGLVGQPVGSRLILSIPPHKGYGKEGNESAGIKGTDTLVFVVDILAAN